MLKVTYQKQNTKGQNKGFAIGAILLAVVLIAAVVAAIAAGSSSSSLMSSREQSRVSASTIVQQGLDLKNALEVAINSYKIPFADIWLASDTTDTDPVQAASPTSCTPADNEYCFYDTADGMMTKPKVPSNIGASVNDWGLNDMAMTIGGQEIGTTAEDYVVFLGPLDESVCVQLNSILHEDSITADPMPKGEANDPYADATNVFTVTDVANIGRLNGCAVNAGQHYYYQVVVIR